MDKVLPANNKIRTTPAFADDFMACPESRREVDFPIRPPSNMDGMAVGSIVHQRIDHTLTDRPLNPIPPGVDSDEVDKLVAYAMVAWKELHQHFPTFNCEVGFSAPFAGFTPQPGTKADVIHHGITRASIVDWKTDHEIPHHRYRDQMRMMASITLRKSPSLEEVSVTKVWLRHWSYETDIFTHEDADRLEHEMQRRHDHPDFRPGQVCLRCRRRTDCPGLKRWLGGSMECLTEVTGLALTDETGIRLTQALDQVRALETLCSDARGAIKQHVINAGGSVPTSDGKHLTIRTKDVRTINAAKAWPVLRKYVDDHQIAGLVKLSIGATEKAVKAAADVGDKKMALEQFREDLEAEEGAITVKQSHELKETDNESTD